VHCRYAFTEDNCIHGKSCLKKKRGEECGFGVRVREETLVTGAALLRARGIGPCPGHAAHLSAAGCESTADEQARLRRGILWACTSAAKPGRGMLARTVTLWMCLLESTWRLQSAVLTVP